MSQKCLHCFQRDTKSAKRVCPECERRGHRPPLESCPVCPYAQTRQAMAAKPVKVKPAKGQQELF